jgi:cell division protein ZapE
MPLADLKQKVERGELSFDPLQRAAAAKLEALAAALPEMNGEPESKTPRLLARLTRSHESRRQPPKGLYIHGGVGRGKSMLMDLFFAAAPIAAKRRVHFHEFMLEVQKRLHVLRQESPRQDPLRTVADELAKGCMLLCFDEFHVVNIADAMILARLFEGLFANRVVVVATSNWPPRRLYEGGLNRDRFLPFIDLLLKHVGVIALEGAVDYRLTRLRDAPVYHHPVDEAADAKLEQAFVLLADGADGAPECVEVGSRTLDVPRAANGVAVFDFDALCKRPLGAADYLALTERYSTLIVRGVPIFAPDKRNEARRFMTLVDALYERRMMLFISAEAPPDELHPAGDGAFEFQRTASRLMEMQTTAYLESCRDRRPEALPRTFVPFALTNDLS